MRVLSKIFIVCLLTSMIKGHGVIAQIDQDTTYLQEVVITGTKMEIPIEKSGKSVYKLSKKDIESNGGKSLGDLLNEVPGLQVDGSLSNPGANLSYFLRGGRNHQTLILIDGVPMNDPSGITLFYDLRNVALDQIESIEVLKGGLSTMYGSGAAAGVINIKLKSAAKEKFGGQLKLNGGSYGTYGQQAEVSGTSGKLNYMLNLNNLTSEGISAALDESNSGAFDNDGFKQRNALLKLGFNLTDRFSIDVLSGYDFFEAEYDDGAFIDAENVQTVDQFRVGIIPKLAYENGEIKLSTIYNSNGRKFESSFPQEYEGGNLQLDLTNQHNFSENFKGLFGLNFQQMNYKDLTTPDFEKVEFSTFDPYASIIYDKNALNVHVGLRYNYHSEYGGKFVYNINPSYTIGQAEGTRIKISAGLSTAYITPSLYQNYSIYGNTDLNPEEAMNLDAGIGLFFGNKLVINLAGYQRDETNPIDFESIFDDQGNWIGGIYVNTVAERKVYGFEMDGSWRARQNLSFTFHYTFAESDDMSSFNRIPKHKYGGNVTWTPVDKLGLSLKYLYTAERTVFDWISFTDIQLESFGVIDLFATYTLFSDKLVLKGAVNNLADNDFIAVYGFSTRGRNYDIAAIYRF